MSFEIAILLVATGGLLLGLFSIPVTKTPDWSFENIWFLGSLIALLVIPWPLVFLTVPDLGTIYGAIPRSVIFAVVLSGVAWGIGGIFWGRAIEALGMALGVSLLMGIINVFGSLGPLAVFSPESLPTRGGILLVVALAVMLGGVVVISIAGKAKERELSGAEAEKRKTGSSFIVGLGLCLFSGILSAGVNFGFVFGTPIAAEASARDVPDFAVGFAIWSLVFTANYLVNALYGLIMMIRNKTFGKLFTKGRPSYWLGALFMGLAWPSGIIIYGIGAGAMGPFGAYAGFPMMILASILAGNLAGALGGEWKGTSARPRIIMTAGVVILFVAFGLLGYSNLILEQQ